MQFLEIGQRFRCGGQPIKEELIVVCHTSIVEDGCSSRIASVFEKDVFGFLVVFRKARRHTVQLVQQQLLVLCPCDMEAFRTEEARYALSSKQVIVYESWHIMYATSLFSRCLGCSSLGTGQLLDYRVAQELPTQDVHSFSDLQRRAGRTVRGIDIIADG